MSGAEQFGTLKLCVGVINPLQEIHRHESPDDIISWRNLRNSMRDYLVRVVLADEDNVDIKNESIITTETTDYVLINLNNLSQYSKLRIDQLAIFDFLSFNDNEHIDRKKYEHSLIELNAKFFGSDNNIHNQGIGNPYKYLLKASCVPDDFKLLFFGDINSKYYDDYENRRGIMNLLNLKQTGKDE